MGKKYHDNCLVLLTHIPKCAGSSFRESLIRPTVPEEHIVRIPGGLADLLRFDRDFQYIIGHWPYGVHRYFSPRTPARKREIINITVLREPVEQMLSHYHYHIMLEERNGTPAFCSKWPDAVTFYQAVPGWAHVQCRQLAGMKWWHNRSPLKALGNRVPSLLYYFASRNLVRHFDYILFTEQSKTAFPELARQLEIHYEPRIYTDTVVEKRPRSSDLDDAMRDRLKHMSRWDYRLCDFVRQNRLFLDAPEGTAEA